MQQRRFELDWIRCFAVLGIVLFHTLCIFSGHGISYLGDFGQDSTLASVVLMILEPGLLSCLFFLAGSGVFFSFRMKRIGQFYQRRARRLLYPLVGIMLVVNPLCQYLIRICQMEKVSFFDAVADYFTGYGISGTDSVSSLCLIPGLVLLIIIVFEIVGLPVFLLGKSCYWDYERVFRRSDEVTVGVYRDFRRSNVFLAMASILSKPYVLLLLTIPLPFLRLIPSLLRQPVWCWLYIFLLGYLFSTDERYMEALERDRFGYTVISVILYTIWIVFDLGIVSFGGSITLQIVEKYFQLILQLLPVYAVLGYGYSLELQVEGAVLSFLKKIAYPVFLIHMPILLFVVRLTQNLSMNLLWKFVLVFFSTLAASTVVAILYLLVKGIMFAKQGTALNDGTADEETEEAEAVDCADAGNEDCAEQEIQEENEAEAVDCADAGTGEQTDAVAQEENEAEAAAFADAGTEEQTDAVEQEENEVEAAAFADAGTGKQTDAAAQEENEAEAADWADTEIEEQEVLEAEAADYADAENEELAEPEEHEADIVRKTGKIIKFPLSAVTVKEQENDADESEVTEEPELEE